MADIVTLKGINFDIGRVVAVRFNVQGCKYSSGDNTYSAQITPAEMIVSALRPEYERRGHEAWRRLVKYDRTGNIFCPFPNLSHVCGAQGFGQNLDDRCPACSPTEAERNPSLIKVEASLPGGTRSFHQILYSLNQHCTTLETVLAGNLRL